MSKELQDMIDRFCEDKPKSIELKALNDLRNCLQAYYTMENVPSLDENLNIIEKALKEYKELKQDYAMLKEEYALYRKDTEKQIKALEIIKEKRVNVDNFLSFIRKETTYEDYLIKHNKFVITKITFKEKLTQEEYDLLKEVLIDEDKNLDRLWEQNASAFD